MNKMKSGRVGIRPFQAAPWVLCPVSFWSIMDTKICSKCGIEKPVSEFYKNRSRKDGLCYRCKDCAAAYYQDHKDKKSTYNQNYYKENKDELNASSHRYYKENKEKIANQKHGYNQDHREERASYSHTYYQEHKKEVTAWKRKYAREHKEEMALYERNYKRDYPERIRAKSAVRNAIKTGKLIRPDSCSECSKECKPHGHHYLGYEEKHWLDVEWLCASCHQRLHANLRIDMSL
jgi:hypothetical protein